MTCESCGGENTTYQLGSAGHEYWCADCETTYEYSAEDRPPRLQLMVDGKWDELRAQMEEHFASRVPQPGEEPRREPRRESYVVGGGVPVVVNPKLKCPTERPEPVSQDELRHALIDTERGSLGPTGQAFELLSRYTITHKPPVTEENTDEP